MEDQPKFVKVDARFLQAIMDYLVTKPYQEVQHFVEILMAGKDNFAPVPDTEAKETNGKEG